MDTPIKRSVIKALMTKEMLITFLMGFSSGVPLLLTLRTLQAWMTEAGVDLKTIGIFSLAGLPYTLKFVWAPIMDRFPLTRFGRRKSWLIISQLGLMGALVLMAFTDPKMQTFNMALLAVLVSFFSASQDIVVDAYRRESLADEDLGLGSTFYIYGYRVAMWVSGAFALGLAEFMSWESVYLLMAAVMSVGLLTSFWADEPKSSLAAPKTLQEAVVEPFVEFLKRRGAILTLIFILLYKIGDNMAGNMLTPFYLKMGYSKLEIAAIAKTLAVFSTLIGSFIGGALIIKWGIGRCLWIFGILQAVSTQLFTLLTLVDKNQIALGLVITFEDLTSAMGSAVFIAFMASLTNKRFTATQYALLSSLMGVPRVFIAAPTGYFAETMGWFNFFTFCAIAAIPGLLMIRKMQKLQENHIT